MSTVIPADIRRQIVGQVEASDHTPRALDRIATDHGLMLDELQDLIRRGGPKPRSAADVSHRNPVVRNAKHTTDSHKKRCTKCGQTKPLTDFYPDRKARDRHASNCRTCNNKRPPTEARIIRIRARHRAVAALIDKHPDEFQELLTTAVVEIKAEAEQIKTAAEASGNADAGLARLKPGPRRKGEDGVTKRLDVARCRHCHTHHDAEHVCPNCGTDTPDEAPEVLPWVVREWAIGQGLAPVPTRGPLPQRLIDAYAQAHDKTKDEAS